MSIFDIDDEYEKSFADGCESLSLYGKSNPRTTLDGEWTEEELKDNIYDECRKLLPAYENRYKNTAVYDKDLFKPEYLAEKIACESEDVIEVYNKEYDKHRNDKIFGIHWFDEWIAEQVRRIMHGNVVGGAK